MPHPDTILLPASPRFDNMNCQPAFALFLGSLTAFCPFFGHIRPIQDAPRVSSAINRLLASTRFARPNRLKSCASFLANPL
jgi:hypothetical protein